MQGRNVDFLVHMEVGLIGTGEDADRLLQQEVARAKMLAEMSILRRLWRVPGRRANWGIWTTDSVDDLHAAIASLPPLSCPKHYRSSTGNSP